jgi:hypothetical protein
MRKCGNGKHALATCIILSLEAYTVVIIQLHCFALTLQAFWETRFCSTERHGIVFGMPVFTKQAWRKSALWNEGYFGGGDELRWVWHMTTTECHGRELTATTWIISQFLARLAQRTELHSVCNDPMGDLYFSPPTKMTTMITGRFPARHSSNTYSDKQLLLLTRFPFANSSLPNVENLLTVKESYTHKTVAQNAWSYRRRGERWQSFTYY